MPCSSARLLHTLFIYILLLTCSVLRAQAYLELVQDAKNSRVREMLTQTDECLR